MVGFYAGGNLWLYMLKLSTHIAKPAIQYMTA